METRKHGQRLSQLDRILRPPQVSEILSACLALVPEVIGLLLFLLLFFPGQ